MTEEERTLMKEITQRRQLNKKLGIAFEQLLSSSTFDAGAAIAIICQQELLAIEIMQRSQLLEQLRNERLAFAISLDCLLDKLDISCH